MKATTFLVLFSVLSGSAVSAAAVPEDSHAHVPYSRTPSVFDRDLGTTKDLWKRKGGGRSSGGSGGGSGSSGGSRSLSNSNAGGRTAQGSGPPPPYSAGTYSGGAKVPLQAGKSFPATRVLPFVLLGGAALAFWPGWYYGAHMYPYQSHWNYRNRSSTANRNETTSLPVMCGCAEYASCACEENNNQTFIDSTIGNGSMADLKERNVTIGEYKGSKTILINGTLPNGTTAAGGEDDESGAVRMLQALGYWPVVVTAVAAVLAV
ncbi:hypothetical protein RB601_009845 [Gaeumannomyces tritici]